MKPPHRLALAVIGHRSPDGALLILYTRADATPLLGAQLVLQWAEVPDAVAFLFHLLPFIIGPADVIEHEEVRDD